MSNEKPVELTEAEREALFKAGDHHPDQCDCTAFADEVGYASGSEICDALADTYDVVERIKAAARREAPLEAAEEHRTEVDAERRAWVAADKRAGFQQERAEKAEARVARVETLVEEAQVDMDLTNAEVEAETGRPSTMRAFVLVGDLRAALAEPERDEEGGR